MQFIRFITRFANSDLSMTLFISSVLVFLLSGNIQGQEFQLPEGLSFSNQMKYSYDISKKLEITEDWFNLDYRNGIFSAGFRFDTFQPNDPNSAVNRGK